VVDRVLNGNEAWQHLQNQWTHYPLAIFDWLQPGLSGLELCRRLRDWYATVMGFILGLCGLGLYQAVTHAHWQTLDRELESVAGTLHDSVENVLKQPVLLQTFVSQFFVCPVCFCQKFTKTSQEIGKFCF
jgi:CheY-like chemotaxis protein